MRRRDPHGDADRRVWFRCQGFRFVQTTLEVKTYGGSIDTDSMTSDAAVRRLSTSALQLSATAALE
jgi:hypothetical protein